MAARTLAVALRHRGAVTGALVAVLLVNVLVVARLQPDNAFGGSLPLAAHCQGGGPGCAEQPLIPPPVGGLPHFDVPPPPAFGHMVLVAPPLPAAALEAPPLILEPPPRPAAI
ncbi:MAG TPA: hypothetical protein VEZ14_05735 [Dehalococcoidia bacterium]|nr:hypothetical protein [Dehalococcoidia bacterium]